MDTDTAATSEEAVRPRRVEPFTRSMIERYLRAMDLKFLTDPDGDFHALFGTGESDDGPIMAMWSAESADEDVYRISLVSKRVFDRTQWPAALVRCNEWNRTRRWPKAYLDADLSVASGEAHIVLEGQLDLEEGIHQELFADFTGSVILGGFRFWEWYADKDGEPG